jgi:hypothetical protein
VVSGELYKCAGWNYAVTLDSSSERVIMRQTVGRRHYEVPMDRIKSIVVERKSVVPFAALTILSALTTLLIGYGPLPYLINLSPENMGRSTMIGALACMIFALPSISRLLFVNVYVSWDTDPSSLLIRFVTSHSGKRLADTFLEMSNKK